MENRLASVIVCWLNKILIKTQHVSVSDSSVRRIEFIIDNVSFYSFV